MVYKKYMYKGGKRFGPYYFKSVRNKDGSVSSIYLGKKKPENNNFKFLGMIFLILSLVSLLGYFSYTTFVVSDVEESSSEVSVSDSEVSYDEILQEDLPVKEDPTVEEKPNEPIEEEVTEPEINISEPEDDNPINFDNLTEINESILPYFNSSETNISEEVNNTEINETLPDLNISEEINISEINETIYDLNLSNVTEINLTELNLTEINISLNETFNLTNEILNITEINVSMNISEFSYDVIINQPVKFEKTIGLEEEVSQLEVSLPENATNISVYKITNDVVDEKPYKIFEEPIVQESSDNLITGGVIFEIDKISFDVINFFRDLFRFTGLVSFEETATKFDDGSLIVEGPIKDLKVEYYMPGPKAEEIQISDWQKQVILSNPLNYSKILVYTNLPNTKGGINVVNSLNNKIDYITIDSNNDSYYDYIEWVSDAQNETFNVSIVILNFQSFPFVGKEWAVNFNTTGVADLKVTPINGTQWSFDGNTGDLMFWNITCGNNTLNSYYENGSYIVSNYNCTENGSEISHVITSGGHYLEFDYGGQKAYARNAASCGSTITANETLTGSLLGCTGHGITIGAHNITLDCAGFTIDGNRAASRHGINIGGYDYITVKNCIIQEFDNGFLTWSVSTDNLIFNNTFANNTLYQFMFYQSSHNNRILNNTFYGGTIQNAVYLDLSNNVTFTGNNVSNNNRTGFIAIGLSNSTIAYNSFINNSVTSAYAGNVELRGQAFFDNNISNNLFLGGGYFSIRTYTNLSRNLFANNIIANSSNTLFPLGDGPSGGCDNNTFINNSFQKASGTIFSFRYASRNILLNNTFTGAATHIGFAPTNNGRDNLLLNNSYSSISTSAVHNFSQAWFLDVRVNTTDGNLQNANVSVFNNANSLQFSELTDSSGGISNKNLTQYYFNTTTYIYYSNYTINTTSPSSLYGNDSRTINMSTNKIVYITLSSLNSAPNTPLVSLISVDGSNSIYSPLNCTSTISDNDNDKLNVTVIWYNNGVLNLTQSFNNSYNNGTVFSAELGAGNLSLTDVWNCSIRLYDGFVYGGWGNSTGLEIIDSEAPSIYFVDPTPGSNTKVDDNITINVSISDDTQTSAFIDWNRSLIGYWSMDYYDGVGVYDNSSWSNNPDYTGGLSESDIVDGRYGKSIQLDGIEHYLNIGTGIMPDSGYHTITAWVKINTSEAEGSDHYGILVGEDITSPYSGVSLYINKSDGAIGTYSEGWIYSNINKVSDEVWTLIAIKGYKHDIDGYLDISKNAGAWERLFSGNTTNLAVDANNQFNIGRWAGNNYFVYGKLDEVKLYTRELSLEELQSEYNNSVYPLQHAFDNLVRGNIYNYSAYAIDSYGNLNITEFRNLTVNLIPYITVLNLSPSPADTEENLNCNFTIIDSDDTTSLANVSWYNNSVRYSNQIYNVSNNTMFNVTLLASQTTMDEIWNCSVQANDNLDYGLINFSNSVTITGNNAPYLNYVTILPSSPDTTNNLLGYCNASDIDNNGISYYYNWYLNGVLNNSGIAAVSWWDDNEDAISYSGSMIYYARAADEDWETSAYVSASSPGTIYINYTLPVGVDEANITYKYDSSSCVLDNNISCYYGTDLILIEDWNGVESTSSNVIPSSCLNDPSGKLRLNVYLACGVSKTQSHFYEEKVLWIDNSFSSGIEVNVNNLSNTLTNKNDNWTLECIANDNVVNSTTMNTSVIIGNAIPYMQVSRISPTPTTYTNQDLLGYCNASDYDSSDQLTYYYNWYKNGIINNSGKTSTYYYVEDDTEDAFAYAGPVFDPEKSVDENFNNYASTVSAIEEQGELWINYTIPSDVENASLEYKIFSECSINPCGGTIYCYNNSGLDWIVIAGWGANDNTRTNVSISTACLNGEILQLYIPFYQYITDFSLEENRFYEEKVWWNIENKTWYQRGVEVNVNNLSNTLTTKNDNWTLQCISNDNTTNSSSLNSSGTVILNSAPNPFTLSSPVNGDSTYERTINFVWNVGTDNDSDILTYNLVVDDDINFGAPEVNQSGLSSTNYNLLSDLDIDTVYYWKVRSYDGTEYSAFTGVWNITVNSLLDLRAANSLVNFGSIGASEMDNTSDNSPLPFLLENNGNSLINVSINSTQLFLQAPLPSSNYRFKIDNYSGETGAFNWLTSLFDWTDMPSGMISAIDSLKYQNATDTAEVDILINVPSDELAGSKQANITFTASLAE